MNTLLVITLAVALPAYALLWHNQPARTQKEKTSAVEAALAFLLNLSWLTRIAALVAHRAASDVPTKWQTAKIHAHSRTKS